MGPGLSVRLLHPAQQGASWMDSLKDLSVTSPAPIKYAMGGAADSVSPRRDYEQGNGVLANVYPFRFPGSP